MRSRKLVLIFIIVLLTAGTAASTVPVDAFAYLPGFDLRVENDAAVLYLNSETTELAVQLKATGSVWYSNPVNRSQDPLARGSVADELNSQLVFDYFTPDDVRQVMNNHRDSNQFGQAEITPIANGFRVEYWFGQQWNPDNYVPVMIEKERMETLILQNLSEKDRAFVLNQYQLIVLTKAPEGYERVSVLNMDKDNLFGPENMLTLVDQVLSGTARRNLIQSVTTYIVNNRADYSGRQDLQPENFSQLLDNPTYVLKDKIRAWDWTRLIETVKSAGYTPYDTQVDHEANRLDPPAENIRTFFIAVEYWLDGADLVVNVPVSQARFPENVVDKTRDNRRVSFPLASISVLPFFGAAGTDASGYLFVPDGSGGLVYFNSDKQFTPIYEKTIYGRDYALRLIDNMPLAGQQIHLPVFGLKNGDQAFLAIIEEGDAIGRIRADVSGRTDSYNKVYANFNVRPFAQLSMFHDGNTTYLNIYQQRMYQGDIRIRYCFLNNSEADYVGMARHYQQYLADKYGLEPMERGYLPFILELAAAIDHVEPILGVPRRSVRPLTTFAQARVILEQLQQAGIDQLQIRYSGWLKGGLEHSYPTKVRLEPKLGSRLEWEQLLQYASENQIPFYPDVSLLWVYDNQLFDGFSVRTDASRFLSRQAGRIYEYNLATGQRQGGSRGYILSPRVLGDLAGRFAAGYVKQNHSQLALRDYGVVLNSDYRLREDELVDRQQAREKVEEAARILAENYNLQLMIDGANSYLLPYAETLVKVPLRTSSSHMIDQGVPFLPIVLQGYWHFAGDPINLSQNPRHEWLKTLETGASPYYIGTFTASEHLKRTDYDWLYAGHYGDWFDDAVEFYRQCRSVYQEIGGHPITGHQRLAPDVFLTEYAHGAKVIVNYNPFPVEAMGRQVPGEGFIKIGEGDQDEN